MQRHVLKQAFWLLVVAFFATNSAQAGLVFSDNFDPINAAQWTLTSNVAARTGPQGFLSGNALHFQGNGTRSATTAGVDIAQGGIVSFDFRGGNEDIDGTALWEDTDNGENAVLEYSTDGVNFTVMENLDLFQFRDDNPTTTWLSVSAIVPAGGLSANTSFRWRQLSHSGSDRWDHWAIDNVSIVATPEPNGLLLVGLFGALMVTQRRRRLRDLCKA